MISLVKRYGSTLVVSNYKVLLHKHFKIYYPIILKTPLGSTFIYFRFLIELDFSVYTNFCF